jgi:dinuclear metal center YbgI/SA1388 family protein
VKLNELLKTLEEIAPVSLSDEFCQKCGAYDNSGIIIDSDNDVNGVLFSLDFSLGAITEAKKRGINTIVTHHPAIYHGITRLHTQTDPLAMAIEKCIKAGISVISMHLNYDSAPLGIDYYLMRGLGGEEEETMIHLSLGGYGRAYDVEPTTFAKYVEKVKTEFDSDKILVYGNPKKVISRVASFCGAGADEQAIEFSAEQKVDLFVSSDLKHHQITDLLARGINVLQLTHYASEIYGFKRIVQKINEKLTVPTCLYRDKGLQ